MISVIPMLTVQPLVLWPLALIMIKREFNYFWAICARESVIARAAAVAGVVATLLAS